MAATNNNGGAGSQACTLCGDAFVEASRYKAFPMCNVCYNAAHDADLTVARVLKWEAPDHIVDNVWLGAEGAVLDAQWLRDRGINRVLTVAAHMERLVRHDGIEYMAIDVDDDPSELLRPHWDAAFEFIKRDPVSGVLVHCVSGISRSGATVVAYVMATRKCGVEDALTFVKSKRSVVSPNSGFKAQLQAFEAELRSSTDLKRFHGCR